MVGYAYLDIELKVHYRAPEFIDSVDPNFFGRNKDYIIKSWKFDTDDQQSIDNMVRTLKVAVGISTLNDFLKFLQINPVYAGNFEPNISLLKNRVPYSECKFQSGQK